MTPAAQGTSSDETRIGISPYNIKTLFTLRIEHQINDHVRMHLHAELYPEEDITGAPTTIEINYLDIHGEN